jgi:hypothetical protein
MAMTQFKGTVIGVFPTRERAEAAISELERNGFKQVGMVHRDSNGKVHTDGRAVAEGAAVGAGVGALGGALVGLGVWAGVIPIIGPVFAVGALGTVLLNAAGGAALTGLAGALIGWGVEETDARYYESEVKAGRVLVTVHAEGQESAAWDILARHEAFARAATPGRANGPRAAVGGAAWTPSAA